VTPQQLADAFRFIERMNRSVSSIRLAEAEFAPLVLNPDGTPTGHFDAYHYDQEDPEEGVGRIWGVPVQYDAQVPPGRVVVSGAARSNSHSIVDFDLDMGPPIRIHVAVICTEQQAELARRFNDRLKDLRDHVALERHRHFALLADARYEEGPRGVNWVINCCFSGHTCPGQWIFTEDEIAAAGRFDLTSRHGWGAEIEAAKLTPPRERPVAWGKVGLLGGDE
jgi:hypothetical protein